MKKIYLNFRKTDCCRYTSGHRTSDGWVHSYSIDVDYSLTSSSEDDKITLNACHILDRFFAKYTSSHEYDSDRYYNIDEYNHVSNIDITALINELNEIQCKHEFVQTSDTQEYNAKQLLINSKREDANAHKIIINCNANLERQIKKLQEKNKEEIIVQAFPHIKNLIKENQIDFFSKYEIVDSYPLDLLAIHGEYELFISNIIKYRKPPFEKFSEVYTLLTTGSISYFDIINGSIPQLNKNESSILSAFLRELETRYRQESYKSIISFFQLPI